MGPQLSLIEGGAPAQDDVERRLEEIALDIEMTQAGWRSAWANVSPRLATSIAIMPRPARAGRTA